MAYNVYQPDTTPYHLIRWSKKCLSSHYNAIFCWECNRNNSNPWRPNLATQRTNWIYRQHPEARHKQTSPNSLCPSLHGPESVITEWGLHIVWAHSTDVQSDQHHLKTRLSPWALCPDDLAICEQFVAVCYQGVPLSWGGVLGLQLYLGRWCLSSGTTSMPWLQFLNRA